MLLKEGEMDSLIREYVHEWEVYQKENNKNTPIFFTESKEERLINKDDIDEGLKKLKSFNIYS